MAQDGNPPINARAGRRGIRLRVSTLTCDRRNSAVSPSDDSILPDLFRPRDRYRLVDPHVFCVEGVIR